MSGRVLAGEKKVESIPERRMTGKPEVKAASEPQSASGEIRVWRCKVCGYLCARAAPPEVCPICKVGKERFELFDLEKGG